MKTTKKLDQLFKIQEIGLDTSNLSYIPDSEHLKDFKYLHTSVNKNNDCMLSEIFTEDGVGVKDFNKVLVTEIDCVNDINRVLVSHLNAIGKDWIDILEIPASCDWTEDTAEQLHDLLESGIIYEISLKDPASVERIEEIKSILKTFNTKLNYISLNICPLNFNLDIINWCKDDDEIGIIGYNPMGGYINSANIIQSFSVPYLLGFASTYCNIVFLSSRDMHKSIQSAKYLKGLIGEFSESVYVLNKSVSKLQKPLKKVVWTSAIFDTDSYIPYNSPENVPTEDESIMITLGSEYESLPEKESIKTELEKDVERFISQINFPFDASKETKFSLAKNQVINCLKSKKPEYEFSYSMINSTTVAVMARKESVSGWFKKTTAVDQHTYLISMMSNGLVYFKECK